MLAHSMEDELRLGAGGGTGEHHGHFAPPPLQAPAPQQAAAPDYYYEEGGPQQQRGTFHRHQHPPPPAPAEDAKQVRFGARIVLTVFNFIKSSVLSWLKLISNFEGFFFQFFVIIFYD